MFYFVVDHKPFSIGSRTSVGQQLSQIGVRLILILFARMFRFQPAYQELDVSQIRKADALERLSEAQWEHHELDAW